MNAPEIMLGIKPSSHGFAWIAFASPFSIHDWGVVESRGSKNEHCVSYAESLIAKLSPHTLVIEAHENTAMSARVQRLYRALATLARDRNVEVEVFGRNDVRACFVNVGARTRDEIAAAVARSFEMLRPLLPPKRKIWDGSHRRMALFDAAALVLTHYHLGASQLFDDLLSEGKKTSEQDED